MMNFPYSEQHVYFLVSILDNVPKKVQGSSKSYNDEFEGEDLSGCEEEVFAPSC